MSYQVKLEVFEGPFDLLLNLISRHKVDIYDVPISQITEEYLKYLDEMHSLDLEMASEFVLVAATLLVIKSAGLVPQPILENEADVLSAFEQRQLLISRLVEYRKFKNAGHLFGAKLNTESRYFKRNASLEAQFEQLLPDYLVEIDLCDLTSIMNKLLENEKVRLIDSEHIAIIKVSVESKIKAILNILKISGKASFRAIILEGDRSHSIATFLAFLELYKQGMADIRQEISFGDIEIVKV